MDCQDRDLCRGRVLRMAREARERRLRGAAGLRLGREPQGFSMELEMYLGDGGELRDLELDTGCAEEWEVRELRGFAMRRGRKGRILRMARAKAARQLRGAPPRQPGQESSILVMPGRNLFSRRAGNNHHVARCGMCHPGRHHGAGGKKASKKCSSALGDARERWLDVVHEARDAEKAGIARSVVVDLAEAVPLLSDPDLAEKSPPTQGIIAARPAKSGPTAALLPPPPVVVARTKTRKQDTRRRRAGCACCPADRVDAAAVADSGSPLSTDFVMVGSNADSEEWQVL